MRDKYKIYIFHPYSKIGGADLSISRLIKNLDKKKFDIDFIFLNQQKLTKYLEIKKRKINFIKIISINFIIFCGNLKTRKVIYMDSLQTTSRLDNFGIHH